MKSGIYSIRHLASGRVYVGSAVDIAARWRVHLCDLRAGKHANGRLQNAWSKYGAAAFEWVVLELVERPLLLTVEQHWIDRLRAAVNGVGYNIKRRADRPTTEPESAAKAWATRRARGTDKWTAEQRAARSLAYSGRKLTAEHRANIGKAGTGKRKAATSATLRAIWARRPPEVRAQIASRSSAAQKGRPVSVEMRDRIAATLRGRTLPPLHVENAAAALRGRKRPAWSERMRSGTWRTRRGMRNGADLTGAMLWG